MPRYRTLAEHLDPAVGPKRMLALDGGGIRGVLTLGMLAEIEKLLRDRHNDPELRLCDYFDLIGGTSTGAIIAGALAMGLTVAEVQGHYRKLGDAVFKRSLLRWGALRPKFSGEDVAKALKSVYGDELLGSPKLRTGLFVQSKRLDTGSPWPLTNNPKARYFGRRPNSKTRPNGEFPLWQVVRASTAAPVFFEPEEIQISEDDVAANLKAVHGEFVDGGVSPANNPSLQMLMSATMEGYHFGWKTGPDDLLVVSVGTGKANPAKGNSNLITGAAVPNALRALTSLMDDCADMVETVMQWLSKSPTARQIDREVLTAAPPLGGAPMLSYLRYNVQFDAEWCRSCLQEDWDAAKLAELEAMDEPENMPDLDYLGRLAGQRQVKAEHFPAGFNLA